MRKMMVLFTALLMLVLAGTAISEGAASVPEELVGIWHGTGTPKNGGPSIELIVWRDLQCLQLYDEDCRD